MSNIEQREKNRLCSVRQPSVALVGRQKAAFPQDGPDALAAPVSPGPFFEPASSHVPELGEHRIGGR